MKPRKKKLRKGETKIVKMEKRNTCYLGLNKRRKTHITLLFLFLFYRILTYNVHS